MAKQRDYILYLEDIRTSMLRIQEYIAEHDAASFQRDYKTADAVIRNFEIIGEATKNLPSSLKDKHPDVPWKEMYRVSHDYFGIDYQIIWHIAIDYLPENLKQITAIIKQET